MSASPQPQDTESPSTAELAYRMWRPCVRGMLRRYWVAQHQLDDALQDVFIVVFTKWATFEGRSSRRTWVLGIARWVALKYRRRTDYLMERHPRLEPDTADELSTTAQRASPFDQMVIYESVSALTTLLATLPTKTQQLFVLTRLEGHSVQDAAKQVDVHPSVAYRRLANTQERIGNIRPWSQH